MLGLKFKIAREKIFDRKKKFHFAREEISNGKMKIYFAADWSKCLLAANRANSKTAGTPAKQNVGYKTPLGI